MVNKDYQCQSNIYIAPIVEGRIRGDVRLLPSSNHHRFEVRRYTEKEQAIAHGNSQNI